MGASAIIRHVYKDIIGHFGEPENSIVFDDPPPPVGSGWPERIDVFHWGPEKGIDLHTFCTVGMADKPQSVKNQRTELHFTIRDNGDAIDLNRVSSFMANLALYPFINKTSFDWAQVVYSPGNIPYFSNCTSVLFHPAFAENGWDHTTFEKTKIKYLNIVPITQKECEFRKLNGPFSIFDYLSENEIDVFSDRTA